MTSPRCFLQGLVGVFGWPVAENPTQAMIEPALAALGLDWRYLTVEVRPEDLADAVRGARAMRWKGFNLTIPHKVAVLKLLDRLSPAAELIGAVNCVTIQDGELVGENTDGKGFLRVVEAIRPIAGLSAVVLGAGGAARAIAFELALAGASRLWIVNRTPNRGRVVQATSIGLFPETGARVPLDLARLQPGTIVCDVIPNPPRTRLLREAESRGCIVRDGLGMLVEQGVIGIRLWSGRDPDRAILRQALDALFPAC